MDESTAGPDTGGRWLPVRRAAVVFAEARADAVVASGLLAAGVAAVPGAEVEDHVDLAEPLGACLDEYPQVGPGDFPPAAADVADVGSASEHRVQPGTVARGVGSREHEPLVVDGPVHFRSPSRHSHHVPTGVDVPGSDTRIPIPRVRGTTAAELGRDALPGGGATLQHGPRGGQPGSSTGGSHRPVPPGGWVTLSRASSSAALGTGEAVLIRTLTNRTAKRTDVAEVGTSAACVGSHRRRHIDLP